MKSLNEVTKIVGLDRRAIQEYEKAGLATKPTTKNKYGYLLYDTLAIERLWQLRFYKELGYNIPKIEEIFNNKSYIEEAELERVIAELKEKQKSIANMITIAQAMKETGLSFNAMKKTITDDVISSEDVFSFMSTSIDLFVFPDENQYNFDIITEQDLDEIFDGLEKIMDLSEKGKEPECEATQKEVQSLHNIIAKGLSKSIALLESSLVYLEPDSKIGMDLEEIYDEGKMDYLRSAVHYYCKMNAENDTDKEINEALENIAQLGKQKYTTNSPEVQAEVKRIHNFYDGVKLYSDSIKLELLKRMGQLYGSDAYKQMIDNGAKKGISWFISRAVEIYCENLEKGQAEGE